MGATGDEFSHSSIAFDINLKDMYSFGTKSIEEKVLGFVHIAHDDPTWSVRNIATPYSLYVTFVNEVALNKMKNRLEFFVKNSDKLKYSWVGLARVFFHIKSPKRMRWFCSAFVAEILGQGYNLPKDSTLYRPATLKDLPKVELVMKGPDISKYNYKEAEKALEQVKKIPESAAMEAISFTQYDPNFIQKEQLRLIDFPHVPIDHSTLIMWKSKCPNLSHVRIGPSSHGELFFDKNKVVGYFSVEVRENCNWLQAFEIMKEYRGKNLSNQLLQRAIRFHHATNLAVDISNEVAIELYLKNGFTEYSRDGKMMYMWRK